ncbi:MAG: ATP-binding protein [Candidatus Lokiarchaeota archaeon]
MSAFANNKGGIIILGISDKSPREIKGLNYIENKINQLDRIIHNFTDYNRGFVKIKPISLKSKEGEDKDCIVVIISQTKECIAVKDKNKNYSYYFRISSGKEKRTFREIKDIKKEINRDNYKFINQLI